jgi:Phosphotransferase enzyme family
LRDIAALAGAPVAGGEIAWGGFSPAANFLLTLDDGRRVFAKGNHPGEMAHGTQNLRQDIAVYETAPALKTIAPRYLGCVHDGDEDGWMLGLWEAADVLRTAPALARVMQALKIWREGPPPDLLSAREKNYISFFVTPDRKWARLRDERPVRDGFLSLFEDQDAARAWLSSGLPALIALQAQAGQGPQTPLHGDLHPSNIFEDKARGVMIVDWPNACLGPASFDLLFLGAALGDVTRVLSAARAEGLETGSEDDIAAMTAALVGFMADQARRAVPERLPRLRWMQKTMLRALLDFLSLEGRLAPAPRLCGQL